jgi:hypothetical protein
MMTVFRNYEAKIRQPDHLRFDETGSRHRQEPPSAEELAAAAPQSREAGEDAGEGVAPGAKAREGEGRGKRRGVRGSPIIRDGRLLFPWSGGNQTWTFYRRP